MPRQAVHQAECDCDNDDAAFRVEETDSPDDDQNAVIYDVRCTCGKSATIVVGEDGIAASDHVSYENASWNDDDSDEEDDEA